MSFFKTKAKDKGRYKEKKTHQQMKKNIYEKIKIVVNTPEELIIYSIIAIT